MCESDPTDRPRPNQPALPPLPLARELVNAVSRSLCQMADFPADIPDLVDQGKAHVATLRRGLRRRQPGLDGAAVAALRGLLRTLDHHGVGLKMFAGLARDALAELAPAAPRSPSVPSVEAWVIAAGAMRVNAVISAKGAAAFRGLCASLNDALADVRGAMVYNEGDALEVLLEHADRAAVVAAEVAHLEAEEAMEADA